MHLMHLRCFFGRHDWHEVANAPDGYDTRVCVRCGKRQWKFENDHLSLDNSWINGELPKPHNPPPPQPPKGGTGKSGQGIWHVKPSSPQVGDVWMDDKTQKVYHWDGWQWSEGTGKLESFEMKVKLDDGLWPEEQGKP